MKIREESQQIHQEMITWRHQLHTHPQTAFEEKFASEFVQKTLKELGIPYKTGYAGTGVAATIEGKTNKSGRTVGFRSDLDALDIQEETSAPYASTYEGKMHACGHDGHISMLLGAAKVLQENPNFDGKVQLIFQPAEEPLTGARAMIKDGVLNDFPCDQIYGMHNWPWIDRGKFGIREGGMMTSVVYLKVTVIGKAGHSGMLDEAIDPVLVGCEIITSLQSLVSQSTNALDPVTLYFPIFESTAQEEGVVPEKVVLRGVLRTFNASIRSHMEQRVRKMCNNIATAYGATATVDLTLDSDEVNNHPEATKTAVDVASGIVGEENVDTNYHPSMSGEDFGSFLREVPGAFIFIGQKEFTQKRHASSHSIHSPYYDFNDDILPIGAEYWVRLAETVLPLSEENTKDNA